MAEYIDKHEAYTLLKDLEAAYIYPPVKEAYATAARRIDQIKPTDVQPVKWISVKDRLPEEIQDKGINSGWSEELRPSDSVLILTTGGFYDVAWYSYVYEDWTTDNEKHSYENWEVAYWQPLPEAPEYGGAENEKT